MVLWITGKAGAGKTTLAHQLANLIPGAMVLDGDDIRKKTGNLDFSDEGRRRNIIGIASTASILEDHGIIPIVACVSPTRKFRDEARSIFKKSILIYVPGGTLWAGTTYEIPGSEEMTGIVKEDSSND